MTEILKEKEEIQEFLKNLGIEYRFSCYSEKNPEGCQLLADYLMQVDHDYEKANKVLKENCLERKYGRSCSSYGMNLLNGRGCKRHAKSALYYFEQACQIDDATGCDFAGKIYAGFEPGLHEKIPPDPPKGLNYLLRGCNVKSSSQFFESSESCYAAAFMLAANHESLKRDEQKAIEVGTKACEMGQMKACKLVSNLYKKNNNEQMSKEFLNRYNRLLKQITDNVEIEMQRT